MFQGFTKKYRETEYSVFSKCDLRTTPYLCPIVEFQCEYLSATTSIITCQTIIIEYHWFKESYVNVKTVLKGNCLTSFDIWQLTFQSFRNISDRLALVLERRRFYAQPANWANPQNKGIKNSLANTNEISIFVVWYLSLLICFPLFVDIKLEHIMK